MMKYVLAGLLLLLCPIAVGAEQIALEDVVKTLEVPFRAETPETGRINDFSAQFKQESLVASIDRVQRGRGEVSFRFTVSPEGTEPRAMFRWEYVEPEIQEIVSDGRTMWVYLPENNQVIVSDIQHVQDQQGDNPVTFLSNLGNLSRDFQISWGAERTDENGNFLLQLVPRKESQLISRMEVAVARDAVTDWLQGKATGQTFPLHATRVTDAGGNRTSIAFQEPRVNGQLPESQFIFTVPAGVEVVKPAEQLNF